MQACYGTAVFHQLYLAGNCCQLPDALPHQCCQWLCTEMKVNSTYLSLQYWQLFPVELTSYYETLSEGSPEAWFQAAGVTYLFFAVFSSVKAAFRKYLENISLTFQIKFEIYKIKYDAVLRKMPSMSFQ